MRKRKRRKRKRKEGRIVPGVRKVNPITSIK